MKSYNTIFLFVLSYVFAKPMDGESLHNSRPAIRRSDSQHSDTRNGENGFHYSGIGPRLLGIEPLDKATTLKQQDASQLTPIQFKNKKYYQKIRNDPESWAIYKAKKKIAREKQIKVMPTEKLEKMRMQTLKRVQKWRSTHKPQSNKISRSNARTRFRDNLNSGTATIGDLESYKDLLAKDRNYQRMARDRKKQIKQSNQE